MPTKKEEQTIGESIKESLRRLTIVTVILSLSLLGVVVAMGLGFQAKSNDVAKQNVKIERVANDAAKAAKNANKALCALKTDAQSRVDTSVQFLKDHPKGAFGFSPAFIQQQIVNSKKSVKTLSIVDCKHVKKR